jgi:hypothetical protein
VSQLRFLSAQYPGSLLLGEWTDGGGWPDTGLPTERSALSTPRTTYPIDPTGCFTLVSTDLPPGPGTRLIVIPE